MASYCRHLMRGRLRVVVEDTDWQSPRAAVVVHNDETNDSEIAILRAPPTTSTRTTLRRLLPIQHLL